MKNEVHLCDCMDFMRDVPDKAFDLAIVDPDFGLNEKISNGGTWAGKYKKQDGFLGGKPSKKYFIELFRISKNQVIWGGNYFASNLNDSRCWLVWDKISHMPTLADIELAWTSFDSNSKMFKHTRNESLKRIHICQKPVKLYKWLLQNYSKPGQTIFDSHVGSGSLRIACYDMGFDFVGCELDPDYWQSQEERFKNHVAQGSLFDTAEIRENIYREENIL